MIFSLTAMGTIFFCSSLFVDSYLVPKWMILAIGFIFWGIDTALHYVYPFKRYSIKFPYLIEVVIVSIVGLEACYGLLSIITSEKNSFSTLTGTFDNTAGFAVCLCAGFPYCLQLATKKRRHKFLGIIVGIIITIAMIFSHSRTGIMSLSIVFSIWLWKYLRFSKEERKYFFYFFSFLIVSLYWMKKDSADGRLLVWICSMNMIKDNLLLGWGIGGFEAHYMDYQASYFERNPNSHYAFLADSVQYPFNEYLNVLVSFGIIGILILLLWFIYLYYAYIRHPNDKKKYAILVWLEISIFATFSYPLMYPFVWLVLSYATRNLLKDFYNLPPSYYRIVSVGLFIVCFWIANRTYRQIKAELLWSETVESSPTCQQNLIIEKYKLVYSELKTDRYFLYNYATKLYLNNEFNTALIIALECRALWADYDLELLLAEIYKAKIDFINAEKHYRVAAYMCPNRFVPLYNIVLLLEKQGKRNEAKKMACSILKKKVKIKSATVSFIKNEMTEYINKHHGL